jgi:hypothetical protein
MGKIKFGVNQLNNATPSKVNLYVRAFTVAAGIFLGWMATSTLIGSHSKDVINGWLGLALMLANGLAPLFGVQLTGKVDAEDVTAIDTEAIENQVKPKTD